MPDRSSDQGLPEEWNHGSHAARGPFPAPTAANGSGNGTAGTHRARPSDGHGTGPTEAYGAGPADPLGSRADSYGASTINGVGASADVYGATSSNGFGARTDSYGASTTDGFGARPADTFGARPADTFGARPADTFGARPADTFGARPADTFGAGVAEPFRAGAADPFGDAASLGTRTADPFGPATTAAFAAVPADAAAARAAAEHPAAASTDPAPRDVAETRGFLGALFDFGFTSFVTPKVIKVLYLLIVIGTVVSALVVTIIAFKASTVFGILMLVFGDPLFILIVLAIYRIILEFFVVTFRVAEDVRALRERRDLS